MSTKQILVSATVSPTILWQHVPHVRTKPTLPGARGLTTALQFTPECAVYTDRVHCIPKTDSSIRYPENIPSGTAVPNWAYQVVTTSDLFNVTLAQLTGDAPESSATKATAIVATSTMPISSITGDTQSPNSSPSSSSKSNIGDIVGGAVGGTKPLSARYDGTNSMYTAMSAFTPPVTQPKFYDPSDPSTFPTSAPSPTIHTSPYNDHQNNTIHSGVNVVQSGRPGAYSGVPIL
ncbi:hypothetical protein J3A83DRAFT_4376662 [Scleroderma citrinum]